MYQRKGILEFQTVLHSKTAIDIYDRKTLTSSIIYFLGSFKPNEMARTAKLSGNRLNKLGPPLERYNKLGSVDQLIVFHYWSFFQSGGSEGWDTTKPGRVGHWRHFLYVQKEYGKEKFYSLARVSASQSWKIELWSTEIF